MEIKIGLGTVDKPVSVTKDNVLNFIATALFVNRRTTKENVTVTKEDVTLLAFLEEHKFSLEYCQDEYGSSWEVTDDNDPTWYPRVVGRGATVKAAIEDAIKYVDSKQVK
jgi:hypothetical protein